MQNKKPSVGGSMDIFWNYTFYFPSSDFEDCVLFNCRRNVSYHRCTCCRLLWSPYFTKAVLQTVKTCLLGCHIMLLFIFSPFLIQVINDIRTLISMYTVTLMVNLVLRAFSLFKMADRRNPRPRLPKWLQKYMRNLTHKTQ